MSKADDAIVAAVRMAYKVADAQVQRSMRLAESLKRTGGRAVGEGIDAGAAKARDRSPTGAAMSALSSLEAAADKGGPPMRLIIAYYDLLGSLLGLTQQEPVSHPPSRAPGSTFETQEDARSYRRVSRVRVFLSGQRKRPVVVRRCEVTSAAPLQADVEFYHADNAEAAALKGAFAIADDGEPRLTIATEPIAPAGRWKAALCLSDGEQVGLLEIEL